MREQWNDGRPAHTLDLDELVAVTDEARLALWQVLLNIDLVGTITTRQLPIDDPLPYLLTNPRVVRTVGMNDGVWVNVRDVPICFGARTYGTDRSARRRGGRRALRDRRRPGRRGGQAGAHPARPGGDRRRDRARCCSAGSRRRGSPAAGG